MPVYCYRVLGTDELVELQMSIQEMEARQFGDSLIHLDGGKIGERDLKAEFAHVSTCPGNYPMTSTALGVNPEQRKEAEAHSRKIGVPTHFTKTGDPIFTSATHRRRYCEATQFFDRNAGYRDPTPR